MIIVCKGVVRNGRFRHCKFFHEGRWGDGELVEHQKFHESAGGPGFAWLGFDLSQPFGRYSGRDGKRT